METSQEAQKLEGKEQRIIMENNGEVSERILGEETGVGYACSGGEDQVKRR